MTDEEKKAIETIEELLRSDEPICEYMLKHQEIDAMRSLLHLIEKQSKEIEELKARKYMLNAETGEISEIPINNNYISKDKIKAKIEVLDKQEEDLQNSISDEEREEYSDASISWELMDIHTRREVLQSLLEKE